MSRYIVVLGLSAALLPVAGCGNNAPKRGFATRKQSGAPRAGAQTAAATTPGLPPGSSNVELPATFTVRAGGAIMPSTISGPASVPVLLTVVSEDRAPHQLVVRTPPRPRALRVPPGGRASIRLGAPPRGSYPILLDGTVRAHLVIGVAPGP
jgi:hypothetical protein